MIHTTSLKISKALKEAGIKIETEYWWHKQECVKSHQKCDCPKYHLTTKSLLLHACDATINEDTDYPASTLGELIRELPGRILSDSIYSKEPSFLKFNKWIDCKDKTVYGVEYDGASSYAIEHSFQADTPEDASAKMLIKLRGKTQ